MTDVKKNGASVFKFDTRTIVGMGLLTAIVVVLQLLGSFIKIGPFNISLVLMPIVVGAALYGVWAGGWLGLVFGIVVLCTDGTVPLFMAQSVFLTIVLVLVKGIAAGMCAGLVYKLLCGKNQYLAVLAAAVVCPVVNTGIFLLGCIIIFPDVIAGIASSLGKTTGYFIGTLIVLFNFVPELLVNVILCPAIVRIVNYARKHFAKKNH